MVILNIKMNVAYKKINQMKNIFYFIFQLVSPRQLFSKIFRPRQRLQKSVKICNDVRISTASYNNYNAELNCKNVCGKDKYWSGAWRSQDDRDGGKNTFCSCCNMNYVRIMNQSAYELQVNAEFLKYKGVHNTQKKLAQNAEANFASDAEVSGDFRFLQKLTLQNTGTKIFEQRTFIYDLNTRQIPIFNEQTTITITAGIGSVPTVIVSNSQGTWDLPHQQV